MWIGTKANHSIKIKNLNEHHHKGKFVVLIEGKTVLNDVTVRAISLWP